MRDAHRLDAGRDRSRVHDRDVLTSAPKCDVRAHWLTVKRDLAPAELGAYAVTEREHRRRASPDPQPYDPRPAGRRKAAGAVELDVERGDVLGSGLGRSGHVSEPLHRSGAKERQRDVHELRFHAAQRGKIRHAAECRFGYLDGEWERDEEPYPRRLEPGGVRLVRDKLRDEHHSE